MNRAELIDELAADLRPVRRVRSGVGPVLLWVIGSWAMVAGATLATGELRPGVGDQLVSSLRFACESLVGFAVALTALRAGLALAIPGASTLARAIAPPLLLLAVWVCAYAFGLWSPTFEPSMLGKRDGCYTDTLLFAIAPLIFGLFLLRRRLALERVQAGLLVGIAAGAIPALMMQFACMYEAFHILSHHVLPIVGTAALGAAGAFALPRA